MSCLVKGQSWAHLDQFQFVLADSRFSSTASIHVMYLHVAPCDFPPHAQMIWGHDHRAHDHQTCGRLTQQIFQ